MSEKIAKNAVFWPFKTFLNKKIFRKISLRYEHSLIRNSIVSVSSYGHSNFLKSYEKYFSIFLKCYSKKSEPDREKLSSFSFSTAPNQVRSGNLVHVCFNDLNFVTQCNRFKYNSKHDCHEENIAESGYGMIKHP